VLTDYTMVTHVVGSARATLAGVMVAREISGSGQDKAAADITQQCQACMAPVATPSSRADQIP
jgi:hypothetical protein